MADCYLSVKREMASKSENHLPKIATNTGAAVMSKL